MAMTGEYLGMGVYLNNLDQENMTFFQHCGAHELRVQRCTSCALKRFPPTRACPFCAHPEATWERVSGKGTVYSYGEVHHAIQPVFAEFAPYMLLLVELDEQRNVPNEFDGLRVQGNLADSAGNLADPALVQRVGIGSRVRVVFKEMGEGLAMPLWCRDDTEHQPDEPWRYAIE